MTMPNAVKCGPRHLKKRYKEKLEHPLIPTKFFLFFDGLPGYGLVKWFFQRRKAMTVRKPRRERVEAFKEAAPRWK